MDIRRQQSQIELPKNILLDHIDKGVKEYNDYFGVACPTRRGVDRWMVIYDKGTRIRTLCKRLNKTLHGVITLVQNMRAKVMNQEMVEALKVLSINDIVIIKHNPQYVLHLLHLEEWMRSGKLVEVLKRSIGNQRLVSISKIIDTEVIRLMNEIKWEINNDRYYVVLDTETNSLPRNNRASSGFPVQLAYAILNGNMRVVAARNMYIQPVFPIDPSAEAVHCLSKSYLTYNGYDPNQAYRTFLEDINNYPNRILVAHNLPFDTKVIGKLAWYGNKELPTFKAGFDTLAYFRKRPNHPPRPSNKLTDIKDAYKIEDYSVIKKVKEYFNKDIGNPHNAMFDVATLVEILKQPDVEIS